jgi:membrane-bound metal-dependent hydrolase YbcI (DUF457 family)
MVLGHLTVTSAGHRLAAKLPRFVMPLAPLLLGAHLPDLVDKPLKMAFGLPGRAFGHSLVVEAAIFGLAALALPRSRRVLGPIALGVAIHLLEDWVEPVVLLAPLLGPLPPAASWSLLDSFMHFYSGGGPQVWLEVLAILYWLAVGVRYRWRAPLGSTAERPNAVRASVGPLL